MKTRHRSVLATTRASAFEGLGALTPTDPKSKSEKLLNKCQQTIGKAATKCLDRRADVLAKCWRAVSADKATGVSPDADGKAVAKIAKAEEKKVAAICKACGDGDKACDGTNDFTPAQIGFVSTCPVLAPPGTPTCTAPVDTLGDLVTCVDCVTDFTVDCAVIAAVPGLAAYPAECAP